MKSFAQFLLETEAIKNPEFRKWFRGSKVVDSEGKPQVVYHGSPTKITRFDFKFTNQGNDQAGSGFYFTDNEEEAEAYALDAKTETHTVHHCYLCIKKPLDADKIGSLTYTAVQEFILKSPMKDEALENWGDVEFEGLSKVMRKAIEAYTFKNENLVRGLFSLANDFYDNHVKEFNTRVKEILGYDGVVKHHPNGRTHYVAFFPWQIKHVENKGTFDPDSDDIFEEEE